MSVRFPRRFLSGLAAIVYAVAALPGEGLHLLGHVGHAHFHPAVTTQPHAHHHCCGHHSHQHGGDSLDHESESPALQIRSAHEHDCPICQFFAQGQVQLAVAAISNYAAAVPSEAVRALTVFCAPDVRLHGSRAPPESRSLLT